MFRNISCSRDKEHEKVESTNTMWPSLTSQPYFSSLPLLIDCTVVLRVERSVDILLTFTQSPYKLYYHIRMTWYIVNSKFMVIAIGRPHVLKTKNLLTQNVENVGAARIMKICQGGNVGCCLCKTEIDLVHDFTTWKLAAPIVLISKCSSGLLPGYFVLTSMHR